MAANWNEDARRWYVDGEPVHAGGALEIQGRTEHYDRDGNSETRPAGWVRVQIETREQGRRLDAYTTIEGIPFVHRDIAVHTGAETWACFPMRRAR